MLSVGVLVAFCVITYGNCNVITRPIFNENPANLHEIKEYAGNSVRTVYDLQYKYFNISDEKLPWDEAKEACEGKGMKLFSAKDSVEQISLEMYIRMNNLIPSDVYSGYWVGGRRNPNKSSEFVWESLKETIEDGWLPGEPNSIAVEDCVELKNDSGEIGLNNFDCRGPRRYVCETIVSSEGPKYREMPFIDKVHEEVQKSHNPFGSISDGHDESVYDEYDYDLDPFVEEWLNNPSEEVDPIYSI